MPLCRLDVALLLRARSEEESCDAANEMLREHLPAFLADTALEDYSFRKIRIVED